MLSKDPQLHSSHLAFSLRNDGMMSSGTSPELEAPSRSGVRRVSGYWSQMKRGSSSQQMDASYGSGLYGTSLPPETSRAVLVANNFMSQLAKSGVEQNLMKEAFRGDLAATTKLVEKVDQLRKHDKFVQALYDKTEYCFVLYPENCAFKTDEGRQVTVCNDDENATFEWFPDDVDVVMPMPEPPKTYSMKMFFDRPAGW